MACPGSHSDGPKFSFNGDPTLPDHFAKFHDASERDTFFQVDGSTIYSGVKFNIHGKTESINSSYFKVTHTPEYNDWNAGRWNGKGGVFVINGVGPKNNTINTNTTYYNYGSLLTVGTNLETSGKKPILTVKQNGVVGIGDLDSSTPDIQDGDSFSTARLVVDGDINFTGTLYKNGSAVNFSTGTTTSWNQAGSNHLTASGTLRIGDSSTTITSNLAGHPDVALQLVNGKRLHIAGNSSSDAVINFQNSGGKYAFIYLGRKEPSDSESWRWATLNKTLYLQTKHSDYIGNIVLNPGRLAGVSEYGNVGINIADPKHPLEFGGNVDGASRPIQSVGSKICLFRHYSGTTLTKRIYGFGIETNTLGMYVPETQTFKFYEGRSVSPDPATHRVQIAPELFLWK